MLYFIIVWIILLQLCYVIGIGILNDLKATQFQRQGDRFIAAVWLGITVLASVLLATALLVPLSSEVGGLVAFSLVGIALRSAAARRELIALKSQVSPSALWATLALAIGLANLTSREVTWLDTGLYHYSIIQWLRQFGVVPGIALLFSNLGFTSSWFALTATFSSIEVAAQVSAVINGFALFISVLSAAICLHHFFKQQAVISDWFLALFLSFIFMMILRLELLQNLLISPSPDFPILLLVGIITWSLLISIPSLSFFNSSSTVPIILSAGAVAIKLTALPLLWVTFLLLLVSKPTFRQIGYIGTIVTLLILPALLSGVITSGCPLYPSSLLCLDLPWSVASTNVQKVVEGTHQWSNWYGDSPTGSNLWIWLLWQWFEDDKLNKVTAFLIASSSLAALNILGYSIKQPHHHRLIPVLAIGFSGIGFIMLTSPLFRFSISYTLVIPVLYLSINGHRFLQQKILAADRLVAFKPLSRKFQQMIQVIPWLLVSWLISSSLKYDTFYLLVPPPLQESLTTKQQINDINYFSPREDEFCWSTPLPCAFKVAPDIKLRDPARGISGGFIRQTH
ncbi:MAG: hypothetical protein KME11_22175 [Timaviella obliquedivisa GSE-PSE-MK23-08B]|jgi:hypothetical protein|nr:hypothetical protein [Timaviella obliquedivisa GSE-PSE-MK23-08B]